MNIYIKNIYIYIGSLKNLYLYICLKRRVLHQHPRGPNTSFLVYEIFAGMLRSLAEMPSDRPRLHG